MRKFWETLKDWLILLGIGLVMIAVAAGFYFASTFRWGPGA